jgi:hypothetical protein
MWVTYREKGDEAGFWCERFGKIGWGKMVTLSLLRGELRGAGVCLGRWGKGPKQEGDARGRG